MSEPNSGSQKKKNKGNSQRLSIVSTVHGRLKGMVLKNEEGNVYSVYKKVPYARKPIRYSENYSLRFMAPQPLPQSTKIIDCTYIIRNKPDFRINPEISEDNLYLDIYVPDIPNESLSSLNTKRPVMVFLPSNETCLHKYFTISDFYDGEHFIRENVILVVVSYRTGILGFLKMEDPCLDAQGDLGLKDIQIALKWVKSEIHHFNGDNTNITLFGQGFGAACVHYMLLNKKTHGLYQKAILQSGTALNYWGFGPYNGKNCAKKANIHIVEKTDKEILAELQDLDLNQLLGIAEKENNESTRFPIVQPLTGPTKSQKAFLKKTPLQIMNSEKFVCPCPIIIGYNNHEAQILKITNEKEFSPFCLNFTKYNPSGTQNSEKTRKVLNEMLTFYGLNRDEHFQYNSIEQNHCNLASDILYIRGIRATALNLSTRCTLKSPVYFYRFALDTDLNIQRFLHAHKIGDMFGACHGDELGYLFKSPFIHELSSITSVARSPWIMKFWAAFAKYGNPNLVQSLDPTLVQTIWPKFFPGVETYLNFEVTKSSSEFNARVKPECARMAFWDELYCNVLWDSPISMKLVKNIEKEKDQSET